MKLPEYIKNCIELLEKSGFSAYAVGGAVRDSLLGADPSDWDVTTSATPEQILDVFAEFRTIPTGIKHGTITVLFENAEKMSPVEITTFRIDGEYRDARHPERVEFSRDLGDDLSRRDFTINAMAWNEKDGIVDVFGGKEDLARKIVRTVGEPEKRFSEDALRILRAFRFSAQLGFEIEEKTYLGACKCAHMLKNIARERIGVEFKKLISSQGVVYSLQKMIYGGVWNEVFEMSAPDTAIVSRLDELKEGNFATRLAALIADYEDAQIYELLSSLRLSNDEKKLIIRLCSIKNFCIFDEDICHRARIFLHYYRDILPTASEMLRFYNIGADEFLKIVDVENVKNRPLAISALAVRGGDLLPLCESNYKRVGELLELMLELVLQDPTLNTKEKLIEIAKRA